MTPKTAQSVFLMLAGTFCLIVVGVVGCLIAAIFVFGDGEAQKIISDMTPVALGSIAALSWVFTKHASTSTATMQMANATVASGAKGLLGSLVAQTIQNTLPDVTATPAPSSAATDTSSAQGNAQGSAQGSAQGHA